MIGAQAAIEIFDCDNQINLGPRWNQWLKRLTQYFIAVNIDTDVRKVASLFFFGGTRLQEIHDQLPIDCPESEDTEYKKSVYRLNSYFNPKRNKNIEAYIFSETCCN